MGENIREMEQDSGLTARSENWRAYAYYALMLAVVALAYLGIRAYGGLLQAPDSPLTVTRGVRSVHVNDLLHVLLALSLVIAAARILGALFRFVGQPPVVGEMIAGILLGPSLLGHVAPHFAAYVLPQSVAPLLNIIAQVGVILYMFLVGLELDVSKLHSRAHATVVISHVSIVAPFLLGAGLALYLYPKLSNSSVSFTAFSLFLGVSMSVTAFPVLARILTDRGIHRTKMGTLTLTCAAVDDVSAWCLLAFVVSVTQSRAGRALQVLGMAVGFILFMVFVVRPALQQVSRWLDRKGRLSQGALALVLLGILLSALATESIGIHAIFGAFVLGAIIPSNSEIARELTGKLEDFVVVFLLPAFFAFTGLRTQIGLLNDGSQWTVCALIILVASLGKFGGGTLAARATGLSWRESSALGVLMNTRGLMELIVLNIGLELGVISPTLFAMLVLMALTTTFATTPILQLIISGRELAREANAIQRESERLRSAQERSGILLPVSHPRGIPKLLRLALTLTPAEAPPPRVLALVRGAEDSIGSGFRQEDELSPSRSPVLATAIDVAWSQGGVVTPQAVWTTDPPVDIMRAAEASQVRWIFFEARRSALTSLGEKYSRRGVVGRVLACAGDSDFQVAVLIESERALNGQVTCIVKADTHAQAAVELAAAMARHTQQPLLAVVLDERTAELVSRAAGEVTLQIRQVSSGEELEEIVPEGVVFATCDVVAEVPLLTESFARAHDIVVVQGTGVSAGSRTEGATEQLQTATA